MEQILRLSPEPERDVVVGLESTGHYWEPLAYWLDKHSLKVVQVNPFHTKRAKELLDNSPLQVDPKDAMTIADLVAQGKYLSLVLPRGVYAELRQLMSARARLSKEYGARKNLLHCLIDRFFPEFCQVFPNPTIRSSLYLLENYPLPSDILKVEFEETAAKLRSLSRGRIGRERVERLYEVARRSIGISEGINTVPVLMRQALQSLKEIGARKEELEDLARLSLLKVPAARFMLSVKGVGELTVAAILGETGDLSLYHRASEILKLAGLNLYELSSGTWRGRRRITRRGSSSLRHILYLAAVIQAKRGMPLHPFYLRLRNRGIPITKAFVAVACKLTRLLYALVRDHRCYTELSPRVAGVAA